MGATVGASAQVGAQVVTSPAKQTKTDVDNPTA